MIDKKTTEREKTKLQSAELPHNLEAEQAVLGAMLSNNDVAFSVCELLKEEDLYSPAHRTIFDCMKRVIEKNLPVDLVTVIDELTNVGALEEIGNIDYLTTISNAVPSVENYEYYAKIIKKDSLLRKIINAGTNIVKKGKTAQDEQDALTFAEKEVYEISQQEDKSSLKRINEATDRVMKKLDTIAMTGTREMGIPTGIHSLDRYIHGLHKSNLVLLAARPGVGKTSLAMNIVLDAAVEQKKKCAVFSLEMSDDEIAQRAIFSIAMVSMEKGLNGSLNGEELQKVWAAKSKIAESDLYIDDSGLTTPIEILSKCRRLKREKGLDLVMIDYLQLMKMSGKEDDNRQQEVSAMTRYLKIAARELDVPILLLSQLSRGPENQGRKDHKPRLSDLRESGSIEQDADIVLMIYKPDMYEDVTNPDGVGICSIMVAKHRNGETGDAKVRWVPEFTRFVDLDNRQYSTAPKAKPIKYYDDNEEPVLEKYTEEDGDLI